MTLESLGEISGLQGAYIGQIERDVKKASLQTLARIAEALGISVANLMLAGVTAAAVPAEKEIGAILRSNTPKERRLLVAMLRRLARGLKTLR